MSVEFEPVTLGPPRRRVDPVAVGALVVMLGLVAAVVKPWNAGVAPASTPDSLTGPHPTAAPALPRILTASTAALASWDNVRAAIRPHDAWGVRAIVSVPSATISPVRDQRFAEIWDALPDDSAGIPTVDIEPNGQTPVAIGITFPASHAPLDARIWLIHPDRLEWIDTQAIEPSPSGGAFLYRVATGGGSIQNWRAGRYRVDVLVDGGVLRFGFTLPNRFEIVPDGSEPAPARDDLVDPARAALPDSPIGLFVSVDGVSIPTPAEEGPPLTEVGAWLDIDPGTGRAPRSYVASAFLPAATGLGVMLPPGSVVQRSDVRRLAPEPLAADPELVQNVAAIHRNLNAHVLYRPAGGGAWPPGVYRLSVVWADSAGLHDRSWHVELRPGPVRELPSMLLAARGFARYAGSSGVVVGTAEPLEGGPRSVAIRLLRPRPAGATGFPARDQVRCDGVRVDGLAGIAGVAYPVDAPSKVTAHVLYEFSQSEEQPILTAGGDVPGLVLVAPAGEFAPTSSVYRVRVGDDTGTPGTTVCLWTTPAS